MNVKYKKYIDYIVNDIELPYLKYLNMYGLKQDEMDLVLGIIFNQPVTIGDNYVYDKNGRVIYFEDSNGYWAKREYDNQNNEIYFEDGNGYWAKREYDNQNNLIYREDSDGYWGKREYDNQNNLIYREDSDGAIIDRR
jgi:hypothetical protein